MNDNNLLNGGNGAAGMKVCSTVNGSQMMQQRLKAPISSIIPKTIVLQGTMAAGKDTAYFDNSIGTYVPFSVVPAGTSQELAPQGALTSDNLKKFLQSYALIVSNWNYRSDVESQLANDVQIISTSIDKRTISDIASVATAENNQQFTNKLQSLYNYPFVWDAITGFKIDSAEGNLISLAFNIAAVVPYGQLDEFLANNPYVYSGNCGC